MRPQTIRSFALLGACSFAAANDIVSLIIPAADDQELVGEVIGNAGPTTTYRIFCPETLDETECGVNSNGLTVAAAPTAFVYEYTFEDYYLRESCKHSGTTWFSCQVTNTQSDMSIVTSATVDEAMPYIAVTITATVTDADADTTTTPTATASTSTSDSDSEASSTTSSGSASVTPAPSQSASNTTTAADPEETTPDNAAMPLAAGSAAQWIVSGAGMLVALALA
ncbi:putative GPI anchored glycoprotein [Aspergillus mulundensis]|uniref:Uncharacterized protein n=1 Tax=Aspergillus mulundensis TaxID=1810919 RepID=A0A3D8S6L7_9EURO|nr:hypothetical protein DSM5745_05268 [Aspergillus mulundensis]RDW81711.1 hypothetical protein DSM5745_05268 [Aspergillus mulundensis]